jgi:hypothetical protein
VTDHVSDLQWDRLLAGELSADAGDAARAHAAGCAACEARLRTLTAERDAFRLRPIAFPLAHAPRRRWRWWLAPLAPLVAAAAVLLVLRAREGEPGEPGERPKGTGPVLVLAAGQPGALVPVGAGDLVRPGEYLQAGYTAARDGFGAVLSRDGAGSVMTYVPARGDAMVALPAGADRSFPQSTVLDDVVGAERIAIIWCEAAHPLEPLLADLRAGRPLAAPAGCTVRELALDKRAGPP